MILTAWLPGVAPALAEKLIVLVVFISAALKKAVTPVGRPVTARITGTLKSF